MDRRQRRAALQMKAAAAQQQRDRAQSPRRSHPVQSTTMLIELALHVESPCAPACPRRTSHVLVRQRGGLDVSSSAVAGTVTLPRSLPFTCTTSSISSCRSASSSPARPSAHPAGRRLLGEPELHPQCMGDVRSDRIQRAQQNAQRLRAAPRAGSRRVLRAAPGRSASSCRRNDRVVLHALIVVQRLLQRRDGSRDESSSSAPSSDACTSCAARHAIRSRCSWQNDHRRLQEAMHAFGAGVRPRRALDPADPQTSRTHAPCPRRSAR